MQMKNSQKKESKRMLIGQTETIKHQIETNGNYKTSNRNVKPYAERMSKKIATSKMV